MVKLWVKDPCDETYMSWPARVACGAAKRRQLLSPGHAPGGGDAQDSRSRHAATHEWPIVGVRGVHLDAPSWHCLTAEERDVCG